MTKIAAEFGGQTKVDEYLYEKSSGNANAASYAQDNLVSRYRINGSGTRYVDYTYDALNRLTKQSLALNGTALLSEYSYYDSERGDIYTTTQLETETLDNTVYKYYYDTVGNITGVDTSKKSTPSVIETSTSYAYDKKNQLLSETITKKDADGKITATSTTSFTYDDIGNITEKTLSDGTTIAYNYGKDADAGWNHILTAVNLDGDLKSDSTPNYETNETIDYDAIGNPTKYLGASLTWNGRELTGYNVEDDAKTTENEYLDVNYTYDSEGLRATKIVTKKSETDNTTDVETKHIYHYVGGQLRYEERGSAKFYYFYDASGKISLVQYYSPSKTVGYYTLTNSRGDVIALYDGSGKCVVEYEYDAWGNCTIVSDSTGFNFGELNPIRYRGYYYDSETGLYYLQSRYYDPKVGRFLNGDIQLSLSVGVLGANVFAYCINNPVNKIDFGGNKPGDLFDSIDEAAKDAAIYLGTLSFENGWEYATSIYSVKKWQTTYETVTKTHKFLWWSWTTTSTKKRVSLVTKYTYSICSTIEDPLKVIVPDAPKFKKRVATVHTHPMGSGIGITQFSQADKDRAVDRGVPNYVYGPNGELRKYDPVTGNDILLFNDLPVSTKEPWLD